LAAACAHAQGRFWEFHDLVFGERTALFGASDFEEALAALATRSGLDSTTWQSCRAAPGADAVVIEAMTLGVRVGVPGTPTFVVNGVLLVGNQPGQYQSVCCCSGQRQLYPWVTCSVADRGPS
jgi:protein-disulfide isomerase